MRSRTRYAMMLAAAATVAGMTGWGSSAGAATQLQNNAVLTLTGTTTPGLAGQYYDVLQVSPNFDATNFPNYQGVLNGIQSAPLSNGQPAAYSDINFNNAAFGAGAPFAAVGYGGVDNITARWSGKIDLPAGVTTFATNSDDGSIVYIDGQRIVDNNFFQGNTRRIGSTANFATAGAHEIVVGFYEGGGGAGVEMRYAPGVSTTNVNDAAFVLTPIGVLKGSQVSANANTLAATLNGASLPAVQQDIDIASGANVTINVENVLNTKFGDLSFNGGSATVNVKGSALRFNSTFLPDVNNVTFNSSSASANDQSIALGQLITFGGAQTITKTGQSNIVLDSTAAEGSLDAGSSIKIQGGGLALIGAAGAAAPYQAGMGVTLDVASPAGVKPSTLFLGSKNGDVTFDNPVTVTGPAGIQAGGVGNPGGTPPVSSVTLTYGSAANGVTISGNNAVTLSSANGNTLRMAGAITGGAGSAVNVGGGTVIMNVPNPALAGAINVNGGQLVIPVEGALGQVGGGTTVNGGGQLSMRTNYNGAEPLTLNGTGTNNNGALESSGGSFTYAGPVTLGSDAMVAATNLGQSLTLTGGINTNGKRLQVAGTGDIAVNTAGITGAGGVLSTHGGTVTVNAPSSYTGATQVNSGTFVITAPLTGTSGVSVGGAGVNATFNAGAAVNGVVGTAAGGTYNANAAGSLGTSPMAITGGIVNVNSAAAQLPGGGATISGNGVLRVAGANANLGAGPVTVNAKGTYQFDAGAGKTVTHGGPVNLSGGLMHAKTGVADLSASTITATPVQTVTVPGQLNEFYYFRITEVNDLVASNPKFVLNSTPNVVRTLNQSLAFPEATLVTRMNNANPNGGDNFDTAWTGKVKFANTGVVSVGSQSDDGTVMYIDFNNNGSFADPGEFVLNNNFLQGPTARTAAFNVAAGEYNIMMGFFESGGGSEATFRMQPGGTVAAPLAYGAQSVLNPIAPPSGVSFSTQAQTGGGDVQIDSGAELRAKSFTGIQNLRMNGAAGTPAILRLANNATATNSDADTLHVVGTNPAATFDTGGAGNKVAIKALNVALGGSLSLTGQGRFLVVGSPNGQAGATGGAVNVGGSATLGGNGNAGGPVTVASGGRVAPGDTGSGILSTGNLSLQPGSTSLFKLNGTTPGTLYDQLNVAGTVGAGGDLRVSLGYSPALGDTFTIINNDLADAVSQTFTTANGGAFGPNNSFASGGIGFQLSYTGGDGNDVTLQVTSLIPEPGTVGLLALGSLGVLARRRRKA